MASSSSFPKLGSLVALFCWSCVLYTDIGCQARLSPLSSKPISSSQHRFTTPTTKALPWRGGAESSSPFGFGRRASTTTKTNKRGPMSSSSPQQQQTVFQSPSAKTADQDPTPEEKMATKEMLNSFLTRDSRNTFIGRQEQRTIGVLIACSILECLTQHSLFFYSSVLFCCSSRLRYFGGATVSYGIVGDALWDTASTATVGPRWWSWRSHSSGRVSFDQYHFVGCHVCQFGCST